VDLYHVACMSLFYKLKRGKTLDKTVVRDILIKTAKNVKS